MISDTKKRCLNSPSITIDELLAPSHWSTEIQRTYFEEMCFGSTRADRISREGP